jgi:hypothetical protein
LIKVAVYRKNWEYLEKSGGLSELLTLIRVVE